MVDSSFSVGGPKLFNALPAVIRNLYGSIDTLKRKVDSFLEEIPDQPFMPAYQQQASSKSITDQLAAMRAAGRHLT